MLFARLKSPTFNSGMPRQTQLTPCAVGGHDSCVLSLAHRVDIFASGFITLLLQLLPHSLLSLPGLLRFLLSSLLRLSLGLSLFVARV